MVINKDAETMPHRSSLLTPPPPSSPMQAPSTLPSSSKDEIKNEHCYLCLDGDGFARVPTSSHLEYLWPYFPPNALHFSELEFNFGTRAKIAEHKGKIETIEEEQGDLFAGEEGPQTKPRPIAVKVDQFSSLLFTSGMDNLLKGATVVLLTCGWLVEHEQSFQDLRSSLRW
ncbi:hypothetical protein PAXRUDRAFT_19128 [Paxillus rubicundulus Ve08.2h10]|uniref:Uncharacterized protein n=1 Tax=Paxillus rubicundulus Ve08.2h10 TaxID=930991 RepID=A0A0D0D5E3_9AGAM|nr:hypothetical protein PAXRUDRAFT_19128 [Paxillus rubicundulus Ve08.2h10]